MEEEVVKLEQDDQYNIKTVMDELINVVVKFNGLDDLSEADFSHLRDVLTFSSFVVSGIMYTYGMDPCAGHAHEGEEDE